MSVLDTSVLLCGLAFPDSYSGDVLRKVAQKSLRGVVSNTIREEALRIAISKAPRLIPDIEAFVADYATGVEVTEADVRLLRARTGDPGDDHVVAAAVVSQEPSICTLDLGFFSQKMKVVTREYGIRPVFPSFERWFEDPLQNVSDLPEHKPPISSSRGSITLSMTTMWDSTSRSHIDKRWYVIEAEDIFALWYDTKKQGFRFLPHPLGSNGTKFIGMPFLANQHIRVTVTFDYRQGLDVYIDGHERHCRGQWPAIIEGRQIYIGSSCRGTDHANNAYQAIKVFGEYLSQRTVRIMHEFDQISVSDKDLEIAKTHRWLIRSR